MKSIQNSLIQVQLWPPIATMSYDQQQSQQQEQVSKQQERWQIGNTEGIGNIDQLNMIDPNPIQIIDNTSAEDPAPGDVLSVRNVYIDSYSLIEGNYNDKTGAYVIWNIHLELQMPNTNAVSTVKIHKRYSQIERFRTALVHRFPSRIKQLPALPPKSFISKFRNSFLDKRKKGLEYFLVSVFLNPFFLQKEHNDILLKFLKQ